MNRQVIYLRLSIGVHVRHPQHVNLVKGAIGYRNSRCHTQRLTGKASLAEELAGAQNPHNTNFTNIS